MVPHVIRSRIVEPLRGLKLVHDAQNRGVRKPGPVIVSSFLRQSTGIAEGGRLLARDLSLSGWPVLEHDIDAVFQKSYGALKVFEAYEGGVWITHCNPPELRALLRRLPARLWRSRFRIGFWNYELERLPPDWTLSAHLVDEIWCASLFTASAVARTVGAKSAVRVHPYRPVAPPPRATARTDVPFRVLTMFDANSSFARKNPYATVAAFCQAFDARDASVLLCVKVSNAHVDRAAMAKLEALAENRVNVVFVRTQMTRSEVAALLETAHILLSLHRAEGFGLPILEAMAAGAVPVVTAWSAPAEFVDDGVGVLVPFSLVPVDDPSGRYARPDLRWADADIGAAAKALAALRTNPSLLNHLAAAGRNRIQDLARRNIAPDLAEATLGKWAVRKDP